MDSDRTLILVADRSRLVAEALGALFEEHVPNGATSLAGSLADAVRIAVRDQPRLVVVDAWIGGGHPEAAVRRLLAASPRSTIVVIATRMDTALAARLREAGAAGLHEKEGLPATAHAIIERLGLAE